MASPNTKGMAVAEAVPGKVTSHGLTPSRMTQKGPYHTSFVAAVERNQIPISQFLLACLYMLHIFYPKLLPFTTKFIHLQYKIGTGSDGAPLYDIGIDDAYYVAHWVITLTFLRAFLMQWVFGPLASMSNKIKTQGARTRFCEQSWLVTYYMFSFAYGIYLYVHSPYYMNIDHLYLHWPNHNMTAGFKKYYLISMGFWFQQVFVLHIEKRRKDHYQMLSHHIITCCLMVGSYNYYYFRIGHIILMIMDSVDILFSAAKILRYLGYSKLCDFMFFCFLMSWIILRHGLYNYLYYHAWTKASLLMPDAKCIPGVLQRRCWTNGVINTFLGLLGGLQIITIVWMYLIVKVAYRVVTGQGAEDVRSDESDEE